MLKHAFNENFDRLFFIFLTLQIRDDLCVCFCAVNAQTVISNRCPYSIRALPSSTNSRTNSSCCIFVCLLCCLTGEEQLGRCLLCNAISGGAANSYK